MNECVRARARSLPYFYRGQINVAATAAAGERSLAMTKSSDMWRVKKSSIGKWMQRERRYQESTKNENGLI